MAANSHLSAALRNAMLDTVNTALGANPLFRIYDGTQPANTATAITTQVLLAEIPLNTNPFAAASGGVIDAAAGLPEEDTSANATGTASWGSFVTSGGTRVWDVSVGETADTPDIVIDNKSIVSTRTVRLTALTLALSA